jgi:hypothetical protein
MTVIVAAICPTEKSVVIAADKGAIFQVGGATVMSETPGSKILLLPNGVAIGMAGDAGKWPSIAARIAGKSLSEIPDWIENERKSDRSANVDKARELNKSTNYYLNMFQDDKDYGIRRHLEWGFLGELSWCMDFLVCGIDADGPQLWKISGQDEVISRVDSGGFAAIGSGALAAHISLERRVAESSKKTTSTIYAVYEAKRQAECVPGISKKTDLVILRQGTVPISLQNDRLEPLDEIYQEMHPDHLSFNSQQRLQKLMCNDL